MTKTGEECHNVTSAFVRYVGGEMINEYMQYPTDVSSRCRERLSTKRRGRGLFVSNSNSRRINRGWW